MGKLLKGLGVLAFATAATAQAQDVPATAPSAADDRAIMEMAAEAIVPLRYITVVPDFAVTISAEPQSTVRTLEVPVPDSQVKLKSIHLSAIFMNRQSGQYMSVDCKGIDAVSQAILKDIAMTKDEVPKAFFSAQLKQFEKAGQDLKCPQRPFV